MTSERFNAEGWRNAGELLGRLAEQLAVYDEPAVLKVQVSLDAPGLEITWARRRWAIARNVSALVLESYASYGLSIVAKRWAKDFRARWAAAIVDRSVAEPDNVANAVAELLDIVADLLQAELPRDVSGAAVVADTREYARRVRLADTFGFGVARELTLRARELTRYVLIDGQFPSGIVARVAQIDAELDAIQIRAGGARGGDA